MLNLKKNCSFIKLHLDVDSCFYLTWDSLNLFPLIYYFSVFDHLLWKTDLISAGDWLFLKFQPILPTSASLAKLTIKISHWILSLNWLYSVYYTVWGINFPMVADFTRNMFKKKKKKWFEIAWNAWLHHHMCVGKVKLLNKKSV